MLPSRIVEAVDVLEDGQFDVSARLQRSSPEYFRLDRLEERLEGGVVIAAAFAAHRYLEAVLTQELLIIVGAVLAATVRVAEAAFGRLPQSYGHLYRASEILLML